MSWTAAVPAGSDRAVLALAALGWLGLLAAPAGLDFPALCGVAAAELALDPAGWPLLRALVSPGAVAGGWIAMTAAMMLPLAAPQLRHVVRRAGPGAWVAAGVFTAGWLAVWLAALVVLEVAGMVAAAVLGRSAPAAALAVAVLWQHSAAKRRALRRCDACPPLPWSRLALAGACARLGIATSVRCVTGCWAIMLAAMAFAPAWAALAAAAAVIWIERYRRRAPLAFEPGWPAVRWR